MKKAKWSKGNKDSPYVGMGGISVKENSKEGPADRVPFEERLEGHER